MSKTAMSPRDIPRPLSLRRLSSRALYTAPSLSYFSLGTIVRAMALPSTPDSSSGLRLSAQWPLVLIVVGLGLVACQSAPDEQQTGSAPAAPTVPDSIVSGEELSEVYCQQCHSYTEPDMLPKETWKDVILPRMGQRMGIYEGGERPDSLFEKGLGGQLVREAGIFPPEPWLPREKWEKIVQYYVNEAPTSLSWPSDRQEVAVEVPGFRVESFTFQSAQAKSETELARTTMVQIEESRFLFLGRLSRGSTMDLLDTNMTYLFNMALPGIPSSMQRVGSNRYVTLMRQMGPTDTPAGGLIQVDLKPQTEQYRYSIVADSLQRPVHAAFGDLTGNGRRDIVLSEFGNKTGQLSWLERVGRNRLRKHTLRNQPGALRSVIRDFNGNGRLDVMALMAQGDEGIYLYHNQGDGRFREERLLRFPPTYGSTYFEMADFNDDGHLDILYVAGDNADYGPVMRPYHGVRVFLNDGDNNFEESYFYPLNGAYRATAEDFDGDGDLDIAAISFFPDYSTDRPESFVYLENQGDLTFDPHTFPEQDLGRWITFDKGDLDGDGDQDLVLGPFSAVQFGNDYVPESISQTWKQKGPSLVVLENLRSSSGSGE